MSDVPPLDPAMVYSATVALDGTITAIHEGRMVPTGATAITKEQYDTIVASQPWQTRLLNGVLSIVPPPVPGAVSLEAVKTAAIARIDTEAEEARMRFLTAGAGQMLEYQATQAEAARSLTVSGELNPANYPYLAAEQQALLSVGVEVTLRQVAAQVLVVMEGWNLAGAEIKRLRRGAKLRIELATTIDEALAVGQGIPWPSPPP